MKHPRLHARDVLIYVTYLFFTGRFDREDREETLETTGMSSSNSGENRRIFATRASLTPICASLFLSQIYAPRNPLRRNSDVGRPRGILLQRLRDTFTRVHIATLDTYVIAMISRCGWRLVADTRPPPCARTRRQRHTPCPKSTRVRKYSCRPSRANLGDRFANDNSGVVERSSIPF